MPRHIEPPRLRRHKVTGIWEIVFHDAAAGRQRQRSTGTRDRGEAERFLACWLSSTGRQRPEVRAPDDITVMHVLTSYGERAIGRVADEARVGHAIEALLRFWADRLVSDITEETCARYVTERQQQISKRFGREAGTGTPRRELETLQAAILSALRHGELSQAVPVYFPPKAAARTRWLTRQECARLLRAAYRPRGMAPRSQHLPLFILTALYTGRRKEAILSLAFERTNVGGFVDLANGVIDFEVPGRPLTRKRRGVVPMPAPLLAAMRRRRKADPFALWVFPGRPNEEDVVRPLKDIRKPFDTAVRLAGLEGKVTPHTMRHTAASLMMQEGLDEREIAEWLRMSVVMLRETYAHMNPNYMARIKAALEGRHRRQARRSRPPEPIRPKPQLRLIKSDLAD